MSFSNIYIGIACAGSLLFGYGISCLNCMKGTMASEFHWDEKTVENTFSVLSAAVFLGAAVGSFSGGIIAQYGRRTLNMILHSCFILGSVVSCLAGGFYSLLAGRLLVGYAVGLVTVASPKLISEISPLETRGARGVLHQLFITIGIVIGVVLGTPLNSDSFFMSHGTWMKIMLGSPAVYSALILAVIGFWKKSETPTYLISVGRGEEAKEVLRQMYNKGIVEDEFDVLSTTRASGVTGKKEMGLCELLSFADYRKCFLVGVVLAVGQQLSGINAFVSLSTSIFQSLGLSGQGVAIANFSVTVLNCVMTLPAVWIIEALGRRPLIMIGSLGQAISLAIVPIALLCSLTEWMSIISVISVLSFISFFALSMGPITWVYLNEMFPPEINDPVSGFCAAMNWVAGISIVFGTAKWGGGVTGSLFGLFSVCSFIIFLFAVFFLLETKGRANADSPYIKDPDEEKKKLIKDYSMKYV